MKLTNLSTNRAVSESGGEVVFCVREKERERGVVKRNQVELCI